MWGDINSSDVSRVFISEDLVTGERRQPSKKRRRSWFYCLKSSEDHPILTVPFIILWTMTLHATGYSTLAQTARPDVVLWTPFLNIAMSGDRTKMRLEEKGADDHHMRRCVNCFGRSRSFANLRLLTLSIFFLHQAFPLLHTDMTYSSGCCVNCSVIFVYSESGSL